MGSLAVSRFERMRAGAGMQRGFGLGARIGAGYTILAGVSGCSVMLWTRDSDALFWIGPGMIALLAGLATVGLLLVIIPLAGLLGAITGALIGWLLPLLPDDQPGRAAILGGVVGLTAATILYLLLPPPLGMAAPLALATRELPLLLYCGFAAWLAHSLRSAPPEPRLAPGRQSADHAPQAKRAIPRLPPSS